MPEIRYYTVVETREVKVAANSASDACVLATAAFTHGQNSDSGIPMEKAPSGIWGNTRSRIRVKEIFAKED